MSKRKIALDAITEWQISRATGNAQLEQEKAVAMVKAVKEALADQNKHPIDELTLDRLQEAQDTIENVTNGVGTIIGERVMKTIKAAIDDVTDLNAGFTIRWDADMRAIKRWHESGGDELTWPDHADLCVWLMERVDSMEKALLKLHNEAILSEGQMVKITGLPRVEVRRKADDLDKPGTDPASIIKNPYYNEEKGGCRGHGGIATFKQPEPISDDGLREAVEICQEMHDKIGNPTYNYQKTALKTLITHAIKNQRPSIGQWGKRDGKLPEISEAYSTEEVEGQSK